MDTLQIMEPRIAPHILPSQETKSVGDRMYMNQQIRLLPDGEKCGGRQSCGSF